MLRYSLERADLAERIEKAVSVVLDKGLRTRDIMEPGMTEVSTSAMGDAIVAAISSV